MILLVLKYMLAFIVALVLAIFIGDRIIRSKGYQGPKSEHFNGTIFLNIKDEPSEPRSASFLSVLRWMLSRDKNVWEKRAVEQTKPVAHVEGAELVATMINHASVLIQTQGLNIITDPIYSERASPFSFLGPKRFTDPGVAFDDLPHIDAVLISHNHYDHMDVPTLKRIMARDNPRILVPLGNKDFLEDRDITNVTELDWWQSAELSNDVTITNVPAQHFSARALSDRNKTLWSGYVIKAAAGNIYFAGDTGLGPFTDEIAKHYPEGFRFALLPIGAFRPEWFMREVHISPDEAFAIQRQLNIKDVLAIHFGTFKLADDTQDEPVDRVRILDKNLPEGKRFLALPNGSNMRLTP